MHCHEICVNSITTPEWNEPPPELIQYTLTILMQNNWRMLGWADIVSVFVIIHHSLNLEMISDIVQIGQPMKNGCTCSSTTFP